MNIVTQHVVEFSAREVGLVFGNVKFGELNLRTRIGMLRRDLLPDIERSICFTERGVRFGQRHHCVPIIMLGIFRGDSFEQWARLSGAFLTQQALTQVRTRIYVLRITLEGGAITFLSLVEFALLKINVTQLRIMMRLVEVMDLGLQFPDATAVMRAGQLKTAGGRRGSAIDEKEIEQRCNSPADENENRPKPFLPPDCINKHPDLKRENQQHPDVVDQIVNAEQI